jgi:hypothetical protein
MVPRNHITIFANEKMQSPIRKIQEEICFRTFVTNCTYVESSVIYMFDSKLNATGRIKNGMDSKLVKRCVNPFKGEDHLTTCKHLVPVSGKTRHISVTKIIIIIMDISSWTLPVIRLVLPIYVFSDVLSIF